jgi:hypothetical protein
MDPRGPIARCWLIVRSTMEHLVGSSHDEIMVGGALAQPQLTRAFHGTTSASHRRDCSLVADATS